MIMIIRLKNLEMLYTSKRKSKEIMTVYEQIPQMQH